MKMPKGNICFQMAQPWVFKMDSLDGYCSFSPKTKYNNVLLAPKGAEY